MSPMELLRREAFDRTGSTMMEPNIQDAISVIASLQRTIDVQRVSVISADAGRDAAFDSQIALRTFLRRIVQWSDAVWDGHPAKADVMAARSALGKE